MKGFDLNKVISIEIIERDIYKKKYLKLLRRKIKNAFICTPLILKKKLYKMSLYKKFIKVVPIVDKDILGDVIKSYLPECEKNIREIWSNPLEEYDDHTTGMWLKSINNNFIILLNIDYLTKKIFNETIHHEFAHILYDIIKANVIKKWEKIDSETPPKKMPNDESRKNSYEHFAEAYSTYILKPKRLEKLNYRAYSFFTKEIFKKE